MMIKYIGLDVHKNFIGRGHIWGNMGSAFGLVP